MARVASPKRVFGEMRDSPCWMCARVSWLTPPPLIPWVMMPVIIGQNTVNSSHRAMETRAEVAGCLKSTEKSMARMNQIPP
jgi:hypothetical protein